MRSILFLTLCLTHAACSDCSRSAPADVRIGTGETDFVPLDEADPSFELVHGPQDGWHVLIGLQAAGMDATQVVVAQLTGSIDGQQVARNDEAWLTFRCDAETRSLESWNTFLILQVEDHCPLHEQALTVDVEIEDARGKTASDQVTATILDPKTDTCE